MAWPWYNSVMEERQYTRISDGIIWRCTLEQCRTTVSVRKGSFFDKSHLPLTKPCDLLQRVWNVAPSEREPLSSQCCVVRLSGYETSWINGNIEPEEPRVLLGIDDLTTPYHVPDGPRQSRRGDPLLDCVRRKLRFTSSIPVPHQMSPVTPRRSGVSRSGDAMQLSRSNRWLHLGCVGRQLVYFPPGSPQLVDRCRQERVLW